jgi:PKD repeat protein
LEPTELNALVTVPHGGETYRSGSIRNIRWLSAVPSSHGDATVEIQVSLNGESGPWYTIASDIPNNGNFQWLVNMSGSEYCRIKVIITTSSSISAISTSDFTIIGFKVDAHGPYQGSKGQSIQFTGSVENGTFPYNYHWEFGDSYTSTEQNPTHIYEDNGNYTVSLTVTDDDGVTVSDTTWALINGDNTPPNTPIIDGPATGKTHIEYEYTFVSNDEDNDELYYIIKWGEDIEEETGVFPAGVIVHANHSWGKNGKYTIKAKAIDIYGAESDWGELEVTMPKNKPLKLYYDLFNCLFERFAYMHQILIHFLDYINF